MLEIEVSALKTGLDKLLEAILLAEVLELTAIRPSRRRRDRRGRSRAAVPSARL